MFLSETTHRGHHAEKYSHPLLILSEFEIILIILNNGTLSYIYTGTRVKNWFLKQIFELVLKILKS